jgi:hypothetical protein
LNSDDVAVDLVLMGRLPSKLNAELIAAPEAGSGGIIDFKAAYQFAVTLPHRAKSTNGDRRGDLAVR